MSTIDGEEMLLDTMSTKFSRKPFIPMCSLTVLREYNSSGFILF